MQPCVCVCVHVQLILGCSLRTKSYNRKEQSNQSDWEICNLMNGTLLQPETCFVHFGFPKICTSIHKTLNSMCCKDENMCVYYVLTRWSPKSPSLTFKLRSRVGWVLNGKAITRVTRRISIPSGRWPTCSLFWIRNKRQQLSGFGRTRTTKNTRIDWFVNVDWEREEWRDKWTEENG